jgi:purine-cytosine permease-like protein
MDNKFMKWLGVVADAFIYLGVAALVFAGIAFTTVLPPALRVIGEYCFYGWWVPLFLGYLLKKLVERQTRARLARMS